MQNANNCKSNIIYCFTSTDTDIKPKKSSQFVYYKIGTQIHNFIIICNCILV